MTVIVVNIRRFHRFDLAGRQMRRLGKLVTYLKELPCVCIVTPADRSSHAAHLYKRRYPDHFTATFM